MKLASILKKYSFAIAIIILLNLFVYYGIQTFYKDPSEVCYMYDKTNRGEITQDVCLANNGEWADYSTDLNYPKPVYSAGNPQGYCDFNLKCQPILDIYNRNVAIVSFIIGLVFIVVGIVGIKSLPGFATGGFLLGGVLVIIIQSVSRYWQNFSNQVKFGIITITIILLFYLAIKFRKKFER